MPTEIELAQAIGNHAVAWYGVALLGLLPTTALLWAGLRRITVPRDNSRLTPGAFLTLRLAFGFGAVVVGSLIFAEMAEALNAGEEMARFDTALVATLRARLAPGALQVFAWLTHLGDPTTIVALGAGVAGGLLWRGRRWLALAWLVALCGNGVLNPLLKRIFERVRPEHVAGGAFAPGWSFPSGHSSGAAVAYGMLAYVLLRLLPAVWHLPVVLTAAGVIFTTGCSRVFLQVHYASDVLAGFASGLAWLAVCVCSIELLRARRFRSADLAPLEPIR